MIPFSDGVRGLAMIQDLIDGALARHDELEPIPCCFVCKRAVGDGSGLLPYVRVELAGTHDIIEVCDDCLAESE